MSGIWYDVLALAGLTAMTIAVACWIAIRFVAPVLLAQTRQDWRLARPVWIAFAVGITLTVAGGGLLSIVSILLLTPSSERLPDAAGPVLVFAFVAGFICTALGALGMLIWFVLALVAAVSMRPDARGSRVQVDRGQWRLAIVLAGVMGISGGEELGAVSHAWPLALAIGIASAGITLLIAVIIACIPR